VSRTSIIDWFADPERPVLVIGEIAQAHDGSLGTAHAYIDAVADAGVDAVKFQTHIAAEESTPSEPWRVRFSTQDRTRYDYWKRMEFSRDQWLELKDHAEEQGLLFLSSPFSAAAIDLLEGIGIEAWKVASGETGNIELLEMMASTGKPMLISTGMSASQEVEQAVEIARDSSSPFAVMQCTSKYPCSPEDVGLNVLAQFRQHFDCPVGLSDHSGTIFPSLAATTLGADVLEVHITFNRSCFGPDVPASVTTEELKELVRGVRFTQAMNRSTVSKDSMAESLHDVRALFTRSLVAARDLEAGHVLTSGDLIAKKPGSGISPNRLSEFLGQQLARALSTDELLTEAHISTVKADR
jgi:N-acetylneuraminate synthase